MSYQELHFCVTYYRPNPKVVLQDSSETANLVVRKSPSLIV